MLYTEAKHVDANIIRTKVSIEIKINNINIHCYIIYMPVKLISYSRSDSNASLLDSIAYCARVSNPTNQNNT